MGVKQLSWDLGLGVVVPGGARHYRGTGRGYSLHQGVGMYHSIHRGRAGESGTAHSEMAACFRPVPPRTHPSVVVSLVSAAW